MDSAVESHRFEPPIVSRGFGGRVFDGHKSPICPSFGEPYKAEMQLFTAKIVDMMKQEKLMHLKVDLSFYHRTSQATQVGSPKRPAQGHKAL
ncbi:hypothetical protein LWI28_023516 [Acer negundo]|uniref:Uncharacterized protein n=1 Tax=Acer negundo TaxID=4023 RepID=A0AAD5P1P3_ACENE|nr:hypothetical protein LWI28_023516 [Acer negundo]